MRNLKIRTAMAVVLILCAVMIGVIVGLRVMTNRAVNHSVDLVTQINVKQLNAVNQASTLLSHARLSMGMAAFYLGNEMPSVGVTQLKEVPALLDKAQAQHDAFEAMPKSEQGKALAAKWSSSFDNVMKKVREQYKWLDQGNVGTFNLVRTSLAQPSSDLDAAFVAFTEYADQRGQQTMANYYQEMKVFGYAGIGVVVVTLVMLILIYFVLRRLVIKPLDRAVEELQRIADADLSQEIVVPGRNEIGKLFHAMREMQQSLRKIVGEARDASNSIFTGSTEISRGNTDLSARTEQQAASLEETATSMEQLTATVKQNADNARQASGLANDASGTASHGGEVMDKVITTMQGISDSSKKVAEITGMIDSIAFQTNILALNASVEAARAGEQGRGFAVVAGEVRNLAGSSADAARQIKQLIESSALQVEEGSVLVEQAGTTMREVVAAVKRVTDIMDEISAASQEQSGGIEQVSQAVSQMDEVTQQNAALVEQVTAAASSLEEQAKRLETAVAVFRLADAEQQQQPRAKVTRLAERPALESHRGPVQENPAPAANPALDDLAAVFRQPLPAKKAEPARRQLATAEDDWEEF